MKKIVPMSILWTIFLIHFYTSSAQTPQYCASKGSYPWEQWIDQISVSGGNFVDKPAIQNRVEHRHHISHNEQKIYPDIAFLLVAGIFPSDNQQAI